MVGCAPRGWRAAEPRAGGARAQRRDAPARMPAISVFLRDSGTWYRNPRRGEWRAQSARVRYFSSRRRQSRGFVSLYSRQRGGQHAAWTSFRFDPTRTDPKNPVSPFDIPELTLPAVHCRRHLDLPRTPRKQRWLKASGFWFDETAIELGSVFPGRNADGTPHVGVRALRDLAEGACARTGPRPSPPASRVRRRPRSHRSAVSSRKRKNALTDVPSRFASRAQARPSRACPPPGA